MFSDFENGGDMWTGRGPRERRKAIAFSAAYRSPPVVQVALSMWDMDASNPVRADVKAEAVTKDGFEIVFRTWGDTRVARVRVSWTAFGELPHGDDWELY